MPETIIKEVPKKPRTEVEEHLFKEITKLNNKGNTFEELVK